MSVRTRHSPSTPSCRINVAPERVDPSSSISLVRRREKASFTCPWACVSSRHPERGTQSPSLRVYLQIACPPHPSPVDRSRDQVCRTAGMPEVGAPPSDFRLRLDASLSLLLCLESVTPIILGDYLPPSSSCHWSPYPSSELKNENHVYKGLARLTSSQDQVPSLSSPPQHRNDPNARKGDPNDSVPPAWVCVRLSRIVG